MSFIEPKPQRYRSSQVPPYFAPLPYTLSYQREVETVDGYQSLVYTGYADPMGSLHTNGRNKAMNAALAKFYDEANQAADLAVAMIERKQTIKMIADGLQTLVRVAKAVKRRDPSIVRAIKRRQSKGEDIAKDPAGLWLQYHFGIVPTISDIHHAAGLFAYDFPVYKITGTGGGQSTYNSSVTEWIHKHTKSGVVDFRTKVGATIQGINPDRHLVSMFGFDQPLSIAYELTPFSWFVDYFVNVGDLLSNLEPRCPGVDLANGYNTVYGKGRSFSQRVGIPKLAGNSDLYSSMTGQHDAVVRKLGIPKFALTFSSPFDLSGQRASYIAAVLVGILSSFKK